MSPGSTAMASVRREVIDRNPVIRVRRREIGTATTSTGLDRDELAALIRAAADDSPRSNALVFLLGLYDFRISESLGADVTDLGTERGHRVLTVMRTGGIKATIPLAPGRLRRSTPMRAVETPGRCSAPPQEAAGTGPRPGEHCGGWLDVRFLTRPTLSTPTTSGTPSAL